MNNDQDNEQYILVINSGSSSIKYRVFSFPDEISILSGELSDLTSEQATHTLHLEPSGLSIEEDASALNSQYDGFKAILASLSRFNDTVADLNITAIAHRVVHGGDKFITPTLINGSVIASIETLNHLAPLHNPNNLLGIKICHASFPDIPQVAVFDTAFHQTIAEHVYRYAIPQDWYQDHKIRRYGFHGSSHQYIAQQAAKLLDRPLTTLNIISLHLGNGASVCAIQQGESIDTSMGFTPLEGLIMGSRSGDLDASIPLYIQTLYGLTSKEVEHILNTESGLKALAGTNDVAQLLTLEKSGNPEAKLALDAYIHRIRKYIGAYLVMLGHIDAIVFTAGIGENSAEIRARCCEGLEKFGLQLDPVLNAQNIEESAVIDAGSASKIMVIRSNEALQIAHQAMQVINPQ